MASSTDNTCNVCGKGFTHFKCKVCERLFFTNSDLNSHMTIHSDGKRKKYKCEICDKVYAQKESFERHMAVYHRHVKDFVDLTSQMACDSDAMDSKCESCWKEYLQEGSLDGTMVSNNPATKDFKCTICGKGFHETTNFIAHMGVHVGVNDFKCKYCEQIFYSYAELKTHVNTHRGLKNFKCDICNKEFAYKYCLKNHKVVHTVKKDFKCDVCGKEFSVKSSLDKHTSLHRPTDLREWKCDVCKKLFSFKSVLNEHMKIHSNNAVKTRQSNEVLFVNESESIVLPNDNPSIDPLKIEVDSFDSVVNKSDRYSELESVNVVKEESSDSINHIYFTEMTKEENLIIKEEDNVEYKSFYNVQ